MEKANKGFLFLLIPMFFFSTFEVVSRTVANLIQPTQLTFIRFLIGGLILLPFVVKDLKKEKIRLDVWDVLWLLLLGVLNVSISMNLSQYAIKFTNASISAVLFSANPLFVAIFSAAILREKLTVRKGVGLVVGVVGVVLAFLNRNGGSSHFYLGVALMIAAAIIYGLYTVFAKRTTLKLGSLTTTSLSFLFGCVAMIPWFPVLHLSPFDFSFGKVWWQLLYLSVIVTGIAQFVYFKALAMVDTSLGSMTFFVKPLLASILAAVFLHEVISLNLILGIVLVLVGIYIVKTAVDGVSPVSRKSAKNGSG